MSDEFSGLPSFGRKRGVSEIDPDPLRVQFFPDVVRAFARLEAAVHDSNHFSPEILENLQESADGKPLSLQSAFTRIATVVEEAMKHVHATGDERAKEAVED